MKLFNQSMIFPTVQEDDNFVPHLFQLYSLCCVLLQFVLLSESNGQRPHTHHSVRVVSDPRITSGRAITQQEGWKQPSDWVLHGNGMAEPGREDREDGEDDM